VVVTVGGPPWYYCFTVRTYTGVHQTTPFSGSHVTASGTSGNPSVTVPSASGELVIDVAGALQALTVGGGQTERSNQNNADAGLRQGTSEEAGAASVSMDWSGSGHWAAIGSPLKAAGGTAYTLTANAGSYALTGTDAALTYTPVSLAERAWILKVQ
jgi:hypothetical protein